MVARLLHSSTLKFKQVYNWINNNQCYLCLEPCSSAPNPDAAGVCEECASALPRLSTVCPLCAEPTPSSGICGHCLQHPPSYDALTVPFSYDFPINHMIRQWKFRQQSKHAWLISELATLLQAYEFDVIVPVPSHWRRKLQRGRNHSAEIAQVLSQHFDRPVLAALRRSRATTSQRGLDKHQRQRNLKRAFTLRKSVNGLRVLLVDDVITTGSTLEAAAKALKSQQPKSVVVGCLAKTPKHRIQF